MVRPKRRRAEVTEQREPTQVALLLGQTCSNGTVSGTFETVSFNRGRRQPASPKRRTNKSVRELLENYIATRKAAGEQPTLSGAEELGLRNGVRRSQVREVYPGLEGAEVRRGRPRISPK
jgi:hypothetical protein